MRDRVVFHYSYDPLVSISISTGSWYDGVCFAICTFGYCDDLMIEGMDKPNVIKAGTPEEAVEKAYEVVSMLSPDFVCIHNGFGFNLKRMTVHSSMNDALSCLFETRRLGNSEMGTVLKFSNRAMTVDLMFYMDKYTRSD